MDPLHIFGQEFWHNEAFLIGNRNALLALKKAIDKALENKISKPVFMQNDGEGYFAIVVCAEDLDKLKTAYSAEEALDYDEKTLSPYDFVEQEIDKDFWKNLKD